MMDIFLSLAQAAFGAFVIFNLRNEGEEKFIGLRLGRAAWMSAAMTLALITIVIRYPGLDAWRGAVAMGLIAFIWSYGHSMILSPPNEHCPDKPDLIEAPLMWLFGTKKPADPVGHPLRWTYCCVRYVLPCIGVAWALDDPWVILSGVIISVGYWPLAYAIAADVGGNTMHIGAGIAGAAFYGAL